MFLPQEAALHQSQPLSSHGCTIDDNDSIELLSILFSDCDCMTYHPVEMKIGIHEGTAYYDQQFSTHEFSVRGIPKPLPMAVAEKLSVDGRHNLPDEFLGLIRSWYSGDYDLTRLLLENR